MRKTYEVIVTRDTTESTVIRVEANNAKEAAAEALSESYNGRYIWEQDDTPNTSSDHYTTDVEQDNE